LRVLRPARFRKEGKIYFKDRSFIDFSSNDYLGLSGHPKIKEAAEKTTKRLGAGSSASRLLSGDLDIHHKLEKRIASFKEKEDALIFNSGYQANVGIISSLLKKGDAIFSDKLNHASIIDGMLLSGAKIFCFSHNDVKHLEFLLKSQRNNYKEALIVTETIFSMEGDKPPLEEIASLKPFQAFAVLLSDRGTGVEEGQRKFGDIIIVRSVESRDAMTAEPTEIPWDVLMTMAKRITSEVPGVVRVAYEITPKPPATIEYI